jgi:RNA polymerase sigma-70 factor (ECF subfamily)
MANIDALTADLRGGRERFLALVADVRPDLHRYCARMTGSVSAGEDVVQETLAYAYYSLGEAYRPPQMRSWLFQIAHRRSIDYLRRYDRRMGQPLEAVLNTPADADSPEDALAREEAVRAAISAFLELAPAQRSSVVLKDILGHSVEEIAPMLELTVPAVKAAIHRGRERLRSLSPNAHKETSAAPRTHSPSVARYAALFNARDWDGVRAMLAEDVKLDLVSRQRRAGKQDVSGYLSNYDAVSDWHLVPAWLEGREVVAAFRDPQDERPGYFIELTLSDGLVTAIRDFRYVPYIANDAAFELAGSSSAAVQRRP